MLTWVLTDGYPLTDRHLRHPPGPVATQAMLTNNPLIHALQEKQVAVRHVQMLQHHQRVSL